jgi:thiol-disulfide isomerase/thioredoxin
MKEILILLLAILLFIVLLFVFTSFNDSRTEDKRKKISLYIFLTKNCQYCKEFEKNKYSEIVNELGNLYDIKKIYLENNSDLFNKYNIDRVPTAILENDEKVVVVKGLNKESILEAHQELENNINEESKNNYKKELLIFMSKKCPYCINYLNNSHNKLTNLLNKEYNIKLIFADEDKDDLFTKYKVDYVPKAIILHNNKEYTVNGEINYDNIKNTINEENGKKNILVFLSKRCPHCQKYEKNTHDRLVNELKDKYNIKKIYDDNEKNEELFKKYNIKYVPTLLIVNKDSVKEINGELTSENILKIDNETKENLIEGMVLDEYNIKVLEENNKDIYDDNLKTNTEEKNSDNKNKILVFLSKTCPGCIHYKQNIADNLEKEFGKEFIIEDNYLDNTTEDLFIKYDISFVPQAIVKYNNKEEKVDKGLSVDNIRKTINRIRNKNNLMFMKENEDYKKIMELYSNITGKEDEEEDSENELLVFLSKTCPYCIKYDKEMHNKLEKELENKCKIRKIYSDNDKDNLFSKYKINYVPKGILLSKDRYIPIEGALTGSNIIEYLEK